MNYKSAIVNKDERLKSNLGPGAALNPILSAFPIVKAKSDLDT